MILKLPEKSMENINDKFLDDASLQSPETLDNAVQAKLKRMNKDSEENDDSRVGAMAFNATDDVTQRGRRGRNRQFRGRCFNCNEIGHRANKCPDRGTRRATDRNGDPTSDESASYLIALVVALSSMIGSVKTGLSVRACC